MRFKCTYTISLHSKNQNVFAIDYSYLIHEDVTDWDLLKSTKTYVLTDSAIAPKPIYQYTKNEVFTKANTYLSQSVFQYCYEPTGSFTVTTSGSDSYDSTWLFPSSSTTVDEHVLCPGLGWFEPVIDVI